MDPLADVLAALGAQAMRPTRFEASQEWALSFPARERLKFVAMLRGTAWLMVTDEAPLRVSAGDCCLIGQSAYVIASDPAASPIDGSSFYEDGIDSLRLGGDDVVALGGGIGFTLGTGRFLLDMLPAVMHIPATASASAVIAAVLELLDAETARAAIGSTVVTTRLAEILMVEAIRAFALKPDVIGGWFGALADPRIGRAIHCIHTDIARPWTVADLAAEASMSRAAFSAAFSRQVGQPPLAYVRDWRMTRARAALASNRLSVGTIAADVGYSSQSAFSHAYRKHFGDAPRAAPTDPLAVSDKERAISASAAGSSRAPAA